MPTTQSAAGSPVGTWRGTPVAPFQIPQRIDRDLAEMNDFRVGTYIVQPRFNTLLDDAGGNRRIEPRAMEVLVYMARNADEVLSKERILRAIWRDTFVTENVLAHAIGHLRKVFEDHARNPMYIQTIPKRGYRLMAEVSRSRGNFRRCTARRRIVAATRGLISRCLAAWAGALSAPQASRFNPTHTLRSE